MRAEIIYTPKNEFKEAIKDIERRLEELELSFKPNFMLLFFTSGSFKDWKRYNEFFRERFPYVEMLGCIIEGYAAGDEIWTRGIVALLGEFEGEVKVYLERGNKVEEVCKRLGERIGNEYDSILAMFPAFYFPSRLEFARLFINDKLYYRRYKGRETIEEKKEILRDYSRYLEDHFVFPIDKVLRYLSESTGRETPIIGMNLMPMEAKVGTPIILANYKEVGRGVAAMCFKGKINAIFYDVLPERGNNYEETAEIVKNLFSNTEDVLVIKSGIALGEINGIPPVEFLKKKKIGFEEFDEEKFLSRLDNGKLETVSPYGLNFINKHNYSSIPLGLVNSPINIYPSFMSLDIFFDEVVFMGEIFKGGPKKYAEIVKEKKFNGFDLILLDMDIIPAFKGDVYKVIEEIKKTTQSTLSIFTTPPSAYHPHIKKKSLLEFEDNMYISGGFSNSLLEFN